MGIDSEPPILEPDANNLFVFIAKAEEFVVRRTLGTKKLKAVKLRQ